MKVKVMPVVVFVLGYKGGKSGKSIVKQWVYMYKHYLDQPEYSKGS